MKVFIFSDTKWSMGRVYRDIIKYMDPEFQCRFVDWGEYDYNELVGNYKWCDVCITNLVCMTVFKDNLASLGLGKTIFVSHGFEEGTHHDATLHYGLTSDSIRYAFPGTNKVHLMQNGVDPEQFVHREPSGSINSVGWCGAPRVWWKQISWAQEISERTGYSLSVTANPPFTTPEEWMPMSYDEVKNWYQTVDVLLITSIPEAHIETGPLPAFEAIVSGVLVIGTPVGNFRHVPGPKFRTIDEGVSILESLKDSPAEVRRLCKEQYDYVMTKYSYKVLVREWIAAMKRVVRRKVLVYNKLDWSVARVFKDVEKVLGDGYEFEYYNWAHTTHELYSKVDQADIVLTTLPAYGYLKYGDLSKCVFVCHGYPEFGDVPDLPNTLRFAMTSDTIRHLFPEGSTVLLTPNGVDPAFFPVRCNHSGSISTIGWVGSEDPSSGGHKRSSWVNHISKVMSLEHKFAEGVPFQDMNAWYLSIDMLLVTAGPEPWRETGPLPAYEAIVSGIPVIGTRVGNFASIPGPKFESVEEAILVVARLMINPAEVKRICEEQYEYVMKHHTYEVLADAWKECLR
jgi:glycosyltransferase involved in cell wall biosynthesis